MRRDVGFYVEADVVTVYQAYLNAAIHKPFERECAEKPYHSISFGVNYSFKYNMNGGSCNIHFMPYGTGTAVNMRFSIAQLAGARYERYADDLNKAMQAFLPVAPRKAEYNMDDFLKPQNQITPVGVNTPVIVEPQPVAPAPKQEVSQPVAAGGTFCQQCGNALAENSRFCSRCGTPVAATVPKTCPNCGKTVGEGNAFCAFCGTRL